ncbi:leucine-rich repeat-containing protein 38-like isoform X1 [Simochromis diagramma]|uniref:leucine-rich repeat-containing protein 38-like isoform X1 n=1 Tax=Simochromis diagramma TaxID=43689 RepID=UPI001A7E84CF|nr:leucine-rich repeat-containing protein 38-like isoform X1 [Simochromis diagramma]
MINAETPLTMLLCINWLKPFLALLFSTLLKQGQNCPTSCLCPDHHTVNCSGQGLTGVPDSIPLDVRRLLLSNNWIPWIPSDFLVLYTDLVYLDLRNNSLSQLEPGTLSTSSRLVFLDLGNNNLTEIPSGTFGESRSLIKLRLGDNPYLTMVSRDVFTGLTSLRELELERNGLTGLDVRVLEPLPSLNMVRLEGNPWLCNCHFAKLFVWLTNNQHKLPTGQQIRPTFWHLDRIQSIYGERTPACLLFSFFLFSISSGLGSGTSLKRACFIFAHCLGKISIDFLPGCHLCFEDVGRRSIRSGRKRQVDASKTLLTYSVSDNV